MYVKDHMTKSLVTVSQNQSISEALDAMQAANVERLPVVDDNKKLIGLLTESLIASNTPNNASSLSVFELNYLLNKIQIQDIMIKKPVTIGSDALLEEAATLLLKHDIGCLPVVDSNNILLGIITQSDIFKAFIDLLGYTHHGTRYVINVSEDKPGVMEGISHVCFENNVSISNLAVYNTERGIEVVVMTYGENNITEQFKQTGYNVTSYISLNN